MPGQALFQGQLLHAAAYRQAQPFQGQRVLVVGAGNSAVQIGVELSAVAQVTVASRKPIAFVPQCVRGHDIHFWAWLTGLDRLPLGRWWERQQTNAVLDMGAYQATFAEGMLDRRPLFRQFTEDGVIWEDGRHEAIDSVIFATGYQPNVAYLAALGAVDAHGRALHGAGVSRTTPGLYYVGLSWQRTYASATLRGVGPDAAAILRPLRRYLRKMRFVHNTPIAFPTHASMGHQREATPL